MFRPPRSMEKNGPSINHLLRVMAQLRSPGGCPWDREQDHMSLRLHAIEEVYELMDAIEAGDDPELGEEVGDLLLPVGFPCQPAPAPRAVCFEQVSPQLRAQPIRPPPHVFRQTN